MLNGAAHPTTRPHMPIFLHEVVSAPNPAEARRKGDGLPSHSVEPHGQSICPTILSENALTQWWLK